VAATPGNVWRCVYYLVYQLEHSAFPSR
jgi:hypothetical protein